MDAGAVGGIVMVVGLVALLVGLVSTAFWVWSLVDAARRPQEQWDVANQNKTVWLVIIVVFGVIGSLLYLMLPRPSLKRLQSAATQTFDPTNFGVPDGGLTYSDGGFQPTQP